MTAEELREEIKTRLLITGDYHNRMIDALTQDVKDYLTSAGADVESEAAVGVIARGVADLWNMGAGDGRFSEVFYQRAGQLAIEKEAGRL